jgi:hypothetical protein
MRKNKSGLSLVEIMMAFAILVMSTLSISGLISFGHRGTQKDFRNVLAIQLLEERLNRLLSVPYLKIDLEAMGGATTKVLDKKVFGGTTYEMDFGDIKVDKANYKVVANLAKIPVTLGVRPFEISDDYTYANVESYRFGASIDNDLARFDGSNATKHPYRVIKVHVQVTWIEPVVNVQRRVDAVSFIVDLEG